MIISEIIYYRLHGNNFPLIIKGPPFNVQGGAAFSVAQKIFISILEVIIYFTQNLPEIIYFNKYSSPPPPPSHAQSVGCAYDVSIPVFGGMLI